MRRRRLCIFCAAIFVLLSLAMPVMAAAQTGSVSITLSCGELPVKNGGVITIYKAGDPVPDGYRLKEEFGGGLITGSEIWSAALAQWLSEQAEGNGISRYVDADGNVSFSPLEEGLYLVVQTDAAAGYYPIVPFLVELPYLDQWHIQAEPKMEVRPEILPETGEGPQLMMGMMGMVLSGCGLVICMGIRRRKAVRKRVSK